MSYKKQLKKMDKADLQFICRELGIVCNLNTKTRQQMITKILKPFNCFDLNDCKKRARNRMKRINKKKYKMNEEINPEYLNCIKKANEKFLKKMGKKIKDDNIIKEIQQINLEVHGKKDKTLKTKTKKELEQEEREEIEECRKYLDQQGTA